MNEGTEGTEVPGDAVPEHRPLDVVLLPQLVTLQGAAQTPRHRHEEDETVEDTAVPDLAGNHAGRVAGHEVGHDAYSEIIETSTQEIVLPVLLFTHHY